MLSCVQLFGTLQTGACQASLSTDFPGKNTGMGCHFLLQGIFSTQVSCIFCSGRQILYHCATWEAHCLHIALERSCSVMVQGRYRDEIAPVSSVTASSC